VNCGACRQSYAEHAVEPPCLDGACPTGFDELPEAAVRLLELRALLVSLGELGLAGKICEEHEITKEDLTNLAFIEMTLKELRAERKADGGS